MFAEVGEDCYIEPPLHANMAGAYVHFGKNVYANFNLTLVDDGHIYLNRVMKVQLLILFQWRWERMVLGIFQ